MASPGQGESQKKAVRKVLKSIDDLPLISEVLSVPNGELPLSQRQRQWMAVVRTKTKRQVIILATPEARQSPDFKELTDRCRVKKFDLGGAVLVDEGLLRIVYSRQEEAAQDKNKESDSDVLVWFKKVFREANGNGASDIHIISGRNETYIKNRIYGEIHQVGTEDPNFVRMAAKSIYDTLADPDSKEPTHDLRRPQDASIMYSDNGEEFKLRYAHAPVTPSGFHLVFRILPVGRKEKAVPFRKLGMLEAQEKALLDMLADPLGLIVVAGETGSGKSTSLANMLRFVIEDSEGKITVVTVEDPPEYEIDGAIQNPVVNSDDLKIKGINPFALMVRSAMRRDPNYLLIGETRDVDTAEAAVHATRSGHKVLTSLHASSAFGIIPRLEGLHISRDTMTAPDFLSGLVYQRLVPILCPDCQQEFEQHKDALPREQLDRILRIEDIDPAKLRLRGPGCDNPKCRAGVVGRTACIEIVSMNDEMFRFIEQGQDRDCIRYWKEQVGGFTSLDSAVVKMCEGIVSPVDVERICKPVTHSRFYRS